MENKKQHYVPKVYLRNFSGEDKFINAFDKISGKSYKAVINNICCEDNLYTVWDLNFEAGQLYGTRDLGIEKDFFSQSVEKQLQEALTYFLDIIRWWWETKSEKPIMSASVKDRIAQVIVAQILRMPDMQDYNNNMVQSMTEQIGTIVSSMDLANRDSLMLQLKMIQMENQLNPALSQFNNTFFNKGFFNDFCAAIASNYWTLLCSPDAEFYTCDRPVNLCRHIDEVRPMFMGFTQEGAEVSYTINPCLTLSIWDKHHFADKQLEDCTCRIATRKEIAHINTLRYVCAKRHIFSFGDSFVYANYMYNATKNQ